ncbi:MAG: hypothetical protein ABI474_07560 [Actinomycetota bacterium]
MGRRLRWWALVGVVAVALTSCASSSPAPTPRVQGATSSYGPPSDPTPYRKAINVAAANGLDVWLDADLAGRWRAGSAAFSAGVQQIGLLATSPAVKGVRVANELGQSDLWWTPSRMQEFLADTDKALNRIARHDVPLGVDFVLPELGCLPGSDIPQATACAEQARTDEPGTALTSIDALVAAGHLDRLIIGANLHSDSQYVGWGSSEAEAADLAWAEVQRRDWASTVDVQPRRALSFPLPYPESAAAAAALPVALDAPMQNGITGADVWIWQRQYDGQRVGLLTPVGKNGGGTTGAGNPLWAGLRDRTDQGMTLYTHFSPSTMRRSLAQDMKTLSTVFDGVYIAGGTG